MFFLEDENLLTEQVQPTNIGLDGFECALVGIQECEEFYYNLREKMIKLEHTAIITEDTMLLEEGKKSFGENMKAIFDRLKGIVVEIFNRFVKWINEIFDRFKGNKGKKESEKTADVDVQEIPVKDKSESKNNGYTSVSKPKTISTPKPEEIRSNGNLTYMSYPYTKFEEFGSKLKKLDTGISNHRSYTVDSDPIPFALELLGISGTTSKSNFKQTVTEFIRGSKQLEKVTKSVSELEKIVNSRKELINSMDSAKQEVLKTINKVQKTWQEDIDVLEKDSMKKRFVIKKRIDKEVAQYAVQGFGIYVAEAQTRYKHALGALRQAKLI